MALTNASKPNQYETWATITTTWATETRTWIDAASLVGNSSRPTTSLTNVSKSDSGSIVSGNPFGAWLWLTYPSATGGTGIINTSKPS